jgi:hypothetical protein
MEIAVTDELTNNRKAVDIRIEEVANISFDLGESGQYVDIGEISGRLLVEYELNHGKIRNQLENARSPGIGDRVRAFLEGWSIAAIDTERINIDYGELLMRGTEPLDAVPERIPLTASIPREEFVQTPPQDLKRQISDERRYSLRYDDLESDIRAYLEREGINTNQVSLGSPVHLQARAEPIAEDAEERDESNATKDLYGTKFAISVENKSPRRIDRSTLSVSMPPRVGREIVTLGQTAGSYNPASEEFTFDLPPINAGARDRPSAYELSFVVPRAAGEDLERVQGTAVLNTRQPFSNYLPEAVFDAGGHKQYDPSWDGGPPYVDLYKTCSIQATFSTPTSDIMVGESAKVEKKINIEGVTPVRAEETVESVLRQRGIDASGGVSKEGTKLREDVEVTKFSGSFTGGSVIVDDTRINIDVDISGEVRTGEARAERSSGEALPAKQRNVSIDYGRIGITIRGRGADAEKVDSYLSELRDELRVSLESIAEEV